MQQCAAGALGSHWTATAPLGQPCYVSGAVLCLLDAELALRCSCAPCAQLVVNRAKRAVPYPLLGENTLVLSDVLCVRPAADGSSAMELVCR